MTPIIQTSVLPFQNPAGHWRTNLAGQKGEFKSFVPTPLSQVKLAHDDALVDAIVQARLALADLDHVLENANEPQVDAVIQQEAKASTKLAYPMTDASKRASLLALELGLEPPEQSSKPKMDPVELEKRKSLDEKNLADAIGYLSWRTDELPLSGRLAQEAHGMALQAWFNEGATPGWFRTTPNWMGEADHPLSEATYVPPVPEDMADAIADLERVANEDTRDPALLTALTHYQFEAIHPFLDGNGRIGRALATQLLVERGVLSKPALLLSEELLESAHDYYEALLLVERCGEYERWCRYFLGALTRAARRTVAALA
jgi:Fic family protein